MSFLYYLIVKKMDDRYNPQSVEEDMVKCYYFKNNKPYVDLFLSQKQYSYIGENNQYGGNDIFDGMFAHKLESLEACINDITTQIQARRKLKEQSLKKIDDKICEVDTRLLYLDFSRSGTIPINRDSLPLIKEVDYLEASKGTEEVSCWKDLVFLRKDLMYLLKEQNSFLWREKLMKYGLAENDNYTS